MTHSCVISAYDGDGASARRDSLIADVWSEGSGGGCGGKLPSALLDNETASRR